MSRNSAAAPQPDGYPAEEVLQMIYSFATYISKAYGLHSNQITDAQGRLVVLTPAPGLLVEQWQVSLEAENGMTTQ